MDYLSFAIVLAAIGVILFIAEYFLPTGGILLVCSFLLMFGAVAVIAVNTEDQRETLAAIIAMCIGVPIGGTLGIYAWGRRMALKVHDDEEIANPGERTNVSEAEALLGRIGKTVTPMRPSGAVDFDGRRWDAISEGMLIENNVTVKCIEVKAGKLVVRQIAKPAEMKDFNMDDL